MSLEMKSKVFKIVEYLLMNCETVIQMSTGEEGIKENVVCDNREGSILKSTANDGIVQLCSVVLKHIMFEMICFLLVESYALRTFEYRVNEKSLRQIHWDNGRANQ
jgi:hypothetical protein